MSDLVNRKKARGIAAAICLLALASCSESERPGTAAFPSKVVQWVELDGDSAFNSVAPAGDGALVAAGDWVSDAHGRTVGIAVKVLSNGSIDSTFGAAGIVTVGPEDATETTISKAIVDRAGRIVLCASSYYESAASQTDRWTGSLIRLLGDGSPDATFGDAGTAELPLLDGGAATACSDLAETADGKYLMVGANEPSAIVPLVALPPSPIPSQTRIIDGHAFVARFNPDGSLDSGFGNEGSALLADGYGTSPNLGLDSIGRIVVSYHDFRSAEYDHDMVVTRLLEDGQVDSSFGENGVLVVFAGQDNFSAWQLDLEIIGNDILVAGEISENNNNGSWSIDPRVWKISADGKLDEAFFDSAAAALSGHAGKSVVAFSPHSGNLALILNGDQDFQSTMVSLRLEGGAVSLRRTEVLGLLGYSTWFLNAGQVVVGTTLDLVNSQFRAAIQFVEE